MADVDAGSRHGDIGARRRAADGYRAGGGRARALAVPHRIEELDQGCVVAGVGSRHRGQRSPGAAGCGPLRRTTAGCRKKAPTTRLASENRWYGSSIRSTAPAAISPAARTGASARRWSRTLRRCWRRCSRRRAMNSSLPCAGRARRATTCRFMRHPAPIWIFRASPARSRWSSGSTARPAKSSLHPRIGSLALRLCRVAQGSLDAAFAGGQSRDWDLAAANLIVQEANGRMTALSGDTIVYNRREVTHGVLVAAGRDRHASIVEHFRNRPLP